MGDVLRTGKIEFKHVDAPENPADGLTKPFEAQDYERFRELLRGEQLISLSSASPLTIKGYGRHSRLLGS
ncbi:uncharacterized protein BJX67DRAFT_364386 [Aspergillus lucknowensis]|uniref:Uncharacterized protein n=1 Tax=Aspergillus lucknowensis TaxID=176173 RepID=A0ABR4LFC9_9EURO